MDRKDSKKSTFLKKLITPYRMVIINEETFEERTQYRITKLSLLLATLFGIVALVSLVFSAVAYTPLKEYIPGYDSTVLRQTAVRNIETLDSLERVIQKNQTFINSVGSVILGEVSQEELLKESNIARIDISELQFKTNIEDSLLRNFVEKEDRFNTLESAASKVEYVLFSPIQGQISSLFDPGQKHFGVDVPAKTNTPVKAISDGRVLFSEWTIDTGFVLIIEHSFNLISVYKHNSLGLSSQGDFVKAGQAIALSGNTGELSTGPHLHFELWNNGNPVDPLEYISFE